jgi:hypothetical protein
LPQKYKPDMGKMGLAPHGALVKAEGIGGIRRRPSSGAGKGKAFPLKDCEFRIQHLHGNCTVTANTAEPILQLRRRIAEALNLEGRKEYVCTR